MKYRLAPRSVGMRDRPKGQAIKSISYRHKTDIVCLWCLHDKKVYGIVFIGFVGGFALRDAILLPPLDVTKNLWGEGGLSLKDKLSYIIYNK